MIAMIAHYRVQGMSGMRLSHCNRLTTARRVEVDAIVCDNISEEERKKHPVDHMSVNWQILPLAEVNGHYLMASNNSKEEISWVLTFCHLTLVDSNLWQHTSSGLRLNFNDTVNLLTLKGTGVWRKSKNVLIYEVRLYPISHEGKLHTASVVTIVMDTVEHAIESFESKQPPSIHWANLSYHFIYVRWCVVIYCERNAKLKGF